MAASIKNIAEGTLGAATATIYTVPANTATVVLQINLVNTDTVSRTCNIYYWKSSGTGQRELIPVNMDLDPGYAFPFKLKLTMGAGDVIKGGASSAGKIVYVISGVEIGVASTPTPSVDEATIYRANVLIPPASVMTLRTVGYELVAAPASNQLIYPVWFVCIKHSSSSGWTVPGSTELRAYWEDKDSAFAVASITTGYGLNQTGEIMWISQAISATSTLFLVYRHFMDDSASEDKRGKNVLLFNDNLTTDISTVDGDGLEVRTYYRLLTP